VNNEMFKLVTRRYLAWGFILIATLVISFVAVYGALTAQTELVTMAAGGLLTEIFILRAGSAKSRCFKLSTLVI